MCYERQNTITVVTNDGTHNSLPTQPAAEPLVVQILSTTVYAEHGTAKFDTCTVVTQDATAPSVIPHDPPLATQPTVDFTSSLYQPVHHTPL